MPTGVRVSRLVKTEAIEALRAGVGSREVASLLGISYGAINRWRNEAGLPPGRPGPRPTVALYPCQACRTGSKSRFFCSSTCRDSTSLERLLRAMAGGTANKKSMRASIKRQLIRHGVLAESCAECGLGPEWESKRLVLVLDHINGVNDDNRLENLRLLCPNCDSQAPTFSGRNVGTFRRRLTAGPGPLDPETGVRTSPPEP